MCAQLILNIEPGELVTADQEEEQQQAAAPVVLQEATETAPAVVMPAADYRAVCCGGRQLPPVPSLARRRSWTNVRAIIDTALRYAKCQRLGEAWATFVYVCDPGGRDMARVDVLVKSEPGRMLVTRLERSAP